MTLTAAPSLYMRPDRNLALELVRVNRGRRDGRWSLGGSR